MWCAIDVDGRLDNRWMSRAIDVDQTLCSMNGQESHMDRVRLDTSLCMYACLRGRVASMESSLCSSRVYPE